MQTKRRWIQSAIKESNNTSIKMPWTRSERGVRARSTSARRKIAGAKATA